jgi:hypothetical protein
MGGHAYWYFVPYQEDLQQALDELRAREFAAGRYNPVIRYIKFTEPEFSRQKPGAKHKTIAAALAASQEEGTRSILDIAKIAEAPGYGVAAPLDEEIVTDLYGTAQPARDIVENNMVFLDSIERGQCAYLVLYEGGEPTEICFVGYSYD